MDINVRLNDWKKKLLDLGKRNALINFKFTSKSILKFSKPTIHELWQNVVEDAVEIQFPYIETDDYEDIDEDIQDYEYGRVYTNRKPKDAQRILRNLRKKYKTFIEEQDVNVLYLSFGFLEWTEKSTNQQLVSPLLLVPVSIEWESIKSPMVLKITEDEIVVNPTLAYKLSSDFKVTLPEYQDEEFDAIYAKLKEFADQNGWKVRGDVCLSILSFLKINMYKDLENHKKSILEHKVINAIAGNSKLLEEEVDAESLKEIENFNHDSVTPNETFNVVDADSSQLDAVLCASKNVSFVLQGPPGTGKSQTITNIIASKIADGKKVLFVSEKKAALDVVYKRLKDVGLADFCLTLHSNKANKKETLTQLENVLALSRNKAKISESAKYKLDKLLEDREQLNAYAKEVNETISPLNKSIYYANGKLAQFAEVQDVSFSIPEVRQTDETKYREYISELEKFASLVGEMNDDVNSNPWRNTTVEYCTNEFVHDLGEQKKIIDDGYTAFTKLLENLASEQKLPVDSSLAGIEKIKSLLEVAKETPVVSSKWLEKETFDIVNTAVVKGNIRKQDYLKLVNEIKSAVEKYQQLNGTSPFDADNLHSEKDINNFTDIISEMISANTCFAALKKDVGNVGLVAGNISNSKEYLELNKEILEKYSKDIYEMDTKSLEMRFKYSYSSILKIFKPGFWADQKLLKQLAKNPAEKRSAAQIISLLANVNRRNELAETIKNQRQQMLTIFPLSYKDFDTNFDELSNELEKFVQLNKMQENLLQIKAVLANEEKFKTELEQLLETRYSGLETDWIEIRNALNWIEQFRNCLNEYNSSIECDSDFAVNVCSKASVKSEMEQLYNDADASLKNYKGGFEWFAQKFENTDEIISLNLEELKARADSCCSNTDSLVLWIDYMSSKNKLKESGLAEYLCAIEEKTIASVQIVPVFEKRFFALWLDSVYSEYPSVAKFRHTNHEKIIEEFAELDKQQLTIAQARIKASVINSLPALDTFTSGEVNVLKKELAKQRKIMPIRKLFSKIPNLLMTLKPCLMMSPLSVSQFLESDCYSFDTVIFDEASQVKTENAIGAIFRGKQVIIAGDSHQLPPTNFFTVQASDDDFDSEEDEENESIDSSILDEAMFLPNRELLWHYRSRHEHLIAFSNAKIYKNRLVTFPSNKDKVPDWGVEYIYVENGTYNGKGTPRGNAVEAERVANEVFDHIQRNPDRTLGVITFGVVQEAAIESAINKLRKIHPECEAFFAEDKNEAFFVKSLENVQGDERDTIIFSIGYAKDVNGKMNMRFGPLSMVGGERRLNVAITRAKYNLKLIGSIQPADIDTDRVSQEGPKLLRKYIEFAMKGPENLEDEQQLLENQEKDSSFEDSIYALLEENGYKVDSHVGCSGYRIDIGIKHPEYPGIYVMGIECDGESYSSSRTARERDRLRNDVLELMGWNIYKLWSTDWIKDPVSEKERLFEAINNAISSFKNNDFDVQDEKSKEEPKKTEQKKSKKKAANTEAASDEEELLQLEDKSEAEAGGIEFKEYVTFKSSIKIAEYEVQRLSRYIQKAVEVEQPVHYDVLCQRFAALMGKQKVTAGVHKAVKDAYAFISTGIEVKDDFVCLKNAANYEVRVAGPRQINQISIDELVKGMVLVNNAYIGLTKEELIRETSKSFGFNRVSTNITERFNEAFEYAIKEKIFELVDDKVSVV